MGSAGRGGHAPTSSPHSSPTSMPPTLVCTQGVLVTNFYPFVHAQPALLLRSTGATAARRTTTSRSGTRAAMLINFETHHHPHHTTIMSGVARGREACDAAREREARWAGRREIAARHARARTRERERREGARRGADASRERPVMRGRRRPPLRTAACPISDATSHEGVLRPGQWCVRRRRPHAPVGFGRGVVSHGAGAWHTSTPPEHESVVCTCSWWISRCTAPSPTSLPSVRDRVCISSVVPS